MLVTNKDTSDMTKKLGGIAAMALLAELRDGKKATADHLSSVSGKFSWAETSPDDHVAGLGKIATNDPAESSFGGTTRQLQCFGRIGLTNAGGVDQIRRNGNLSRVSSRISSRNNNGRAKLGILLDIKE